VPGGMQAHVQGRRGGPVRGEDSSGVPSALVGPLHTPTINAEIH
jgi:hypothetical protein